MLRSASALLSRRCPARAAATLQQLCAVQACSIHSAPCNAPAERALAPAAGSWQHNSSSGDATAAAARRGFAAFSRPLAHSGCGHSHHHHDQGCPDDSVLQAIQEAEDVAQLQQLVADGGARFAPAHAAAAFRRAAALSNGSMGVARPAVDLLAPLWAGLLPRAEGADLASCLLSLAKLRLADEALWAGTLGAVPAQVKAAAGGDLVNIAYALASMSAAGGGVVPGVPHEQVKELLRQVTEEVVSLVSGAPAGDGCGGGRSVSVANLAVLRWAHEVFEELEGGGGGS